MKTGKTFKQIFVESVDDLPKENGEYFVMLKTKFLVVKPFSKDGGIFSPDWWLSRVMWYLLEQPEPTPGNKKTAKEWLKDKNIVEGRDRQIIEGWLEEYVSECGNKESKDEAYNNSLCKCKTPVFISGICELCGGFEN